MKRMLRKAKQLYQWYLWHTPQTHSQQFGKIATYYVPLAILGTVVLWASTVVTGSQTVWLLIAIGLALLVIGSPGMLQLGPHSRKYLDAQHAMLRALRGNCALYGDFIEHFSKIYGKVRIPQLAWLMEHRGLIRVEERAGFKNYVDLTDKGRQALERLHNQLAA